MPGRGFSERRPPVGYRIVLPTLPTGDAMKTTVFLHCDIAGRPYRIQDFRQPLETAGVLLYVAGIGPFQMSHVWMLKLKTAKAKERLLTKGALEVKERYFAVIEPNKRELAFTVHWVPFYVSNESVQKALEEFGEVTDVTREQWKSPGFEDAESTTRLVRMVLKEGLSIDDLPHMFKFYGGQVLVVVPGRPPICLRCKRTGHIRRDCRTPRCSLCRSFGHEREGCVRTYARVATGTGLWTKSNWRTPEPRPLQDSATALLSRSQRCLLATRSHKVNPLQKRLARRRMLLRRQKSQRGRALQATTTPRRRWMRQSLPLSDLVTTKRHRLRTESFVG
ncbi:uncharacterized protein LOC144098011 [Amblyomma americanum]